MVLYTSFLFCRFDERISSFAERKFQRDGIEVLTGHRVMGVSDRMINMTRKSTGEDTSIPHGMVVWSTGVGTRPVVKDFMEQIGQVFYILASSCFSSSRVFCIWHQLEGLC